MKLTSLNDAFRAFFRKKQKKECPLLDSIRTKADKGEMVKEGKKQSGLILVSG